MSTTVVTPESAGQAPGNETPEQKYDRLYQAPAPQAAGSAPPQSVQTVRAEIPSELTATLAAIQTGLDELKNSRVPSPPSDAPPSWVEHIRAGNWQSAQAAMAEAMAKELQPKFSEIQQRAYTEATAAAEAQSQMREYAAQVRASNPDLVQFERYIQAPIAERLELAKQAKRINSTGDFVREYKSALDAEVDQLRNIRLQIRGEGKVEGTTRRSEVISSTALQPQQVQSLQIPVPDGETAQETTADYFARRAAESQKRHGMV